MKTAEYLAYNSKYNDSGLIHYKDCAKLMIEFAKLHITEALKAAHLNAKIQLIDGTLLEYYDDCCVNKASIIEAYPLENIK